MVKVSLLGTAGVRPLPNRALTGCYIDFEQTGHAALVDCGEGMQVSLVKNENCKLTKISSVFLTHKHADHIMGLPGLLLSMGLEGRTEDLYLYSLSTTLRAVQPLIALCGKLPFNVISYPLDSVVASEQSFPLKEIDPRGSVVLNTALLYHTAPCLGYSFTLFQKPIFNRKKAEDLKIPCNCYTALHNGESITLTDGRVITSDMVTDGKRPPIKVTYATDTRPTPSLVSLASQSDILIAEAMYGNDFELPLAQKKRHMMLSEAVSVAKSSNSKNLWLTHYSSTFVNQRDFYGYLRKEFPNSVLSVNGHNRTL